MNPVGLVCALAFVPAQHLPAFPQMLMAEMPGWEFDLDFARVEAEWARLRAAVQIPEVWKLNTDGREFAVGEAARARNLSAKFPVVLIPGIISTGLESWSTAPGSREFFRARVWGGAHMLSLVMFNRDRWLAAMLLDAETGLDPPGAKVRAAEGIEAASSFIQGYWLWSKIVENLAVVNYDTNNLVRRRACGRGHGSRPRSTSRRTTGGCRTTTSRSATATSRASRS
jgi:phospholipid:diacylglycerol acyltransferase